MAGVQPSCGQARQPARPCTQRLSEFGDTGGSISDRLAVIAWLHDDRTPLPATQDALGRRSEAPGLLAAGGRLTVARLTDAYRRGVFPWFSAGQPVLWWSPDPRMVLPVAEFKLSRSLRKTIRAFIDRSDGEIRCDHAVRDVIEACAATPRAHQDGTWIVPAMVDAYVAWHAEMGAVHTVETWVDGELIGGLYAVHLGRMLFGESMFARRSDASKIALAYLVCLARASGVELIDCQQETAHLASFGARPISRRVFERHLASHAHGQPAIARWTYDPSLWARLDPRLAGTLDAT
jgi:leucyl/phenylalanyl-tRNA--protein transferase